MKKIALLFVAILFVVNTFAQNGYFDNHPIWKVQSACADPYPCIVWNTYNYYINGDTVINAHNYYKLFRIGSTVYSWMSSPPNPSCQGGYVFNDTVNPLAYIRDTLNRILLYDNFIGDDTLLYDYNLSVGDSLPLSYNNQLNGLVVTTIDSIPVSNYYRKRIEYMDWNGQSHYLIEGIGSEYGFLESIGIMLDCANTLLCFSLNDTSYYPSIGLNCKILLGLDEAEEKVAYKVFPNPATGTIYITGDLKDCQLTLYNNIFNKIKTLPSSNNQIDLGSDVGSLSSGLLFLEILNIQSAQKYFMKIVLKN